MRRLLVREWRTLASGLRALDRQTVFVLTAAALLVVLHNIYGSRRFFAFELARSLPPEERDFWSFGWWFAMQGVLGFLLPVLSLLLIFRRRPREIGLGAGDWRLALLICLAYVPVVALGTWFASDGNAFLAKYPQCRQVAYDWGLFLLYEALFLFYWFGWEYLWRGFVLFGTAHTFGVYAIFVQMVPFAILHHGKPLLEQILSVFGGIALGAICWRCRAFWIAIPIHAAQMLFLDLWCTLRVRTGVRGVGLDAFVALFG